MRHHQEEIIQTVQISKFPLSSPGSVGAGRGPTRTVLPPFTDHRPNPRASRLLERVADRQLGAPPKSGP
jgi:hypothetical protein